MFFDALVIVLLVIGLILQEYDTFSKRNFSNIDRRINICSIRVLLAFASLSIEGIVLLVGIIMNIETKLIIRICLIFVLLMLTISEVRNQSKLVKQKCSNKRVD